MSPLENLRSDPRVEFVNGTDYAPRGRCVVYWMRRAQRALDNPALEIAICLANELLLPVVTFFCLRPRLPHANQRQFAFMLDGLRDTAERLERRGIGFVMRLCKDGKVARDFAAFCAQSRPAVVVTDRNPLNNNVARLLPGDFALPVVQVDADTIVPIALIGREHYAARTIRPRIHSYMESYLAPVRAQKVKRAWRSGQSWASLAPSPGLAASLPTDLSVGPTNFKGGTTEGLYQLRRFIKTRLAGYAVNRNRPELDGTSRLSPYLHFGQLGPHTIAVAACNSDVPERHVQAFLEELVVRRELAINFTVFNARWSRIEACEPWALRTLALHARDPRPYQYNERQIENAETHDRLWNAAQRQMVESGWMHGYMRMYWAKKILEWSWSAAEAYEVAMRLNDRFELDGRDPNGYAGVAWAVGGKHDRAWGPERPVYGKIRYMSASSTGRKFDSRAYIERWLGATDKLR